MEERRKYPRFTINQFIELSFEKETEINAQGINIIEAGFMCHTDEYVDPYTKLFVLLSLNGNSNVQQISVEGMVMRCMKKGKNYETAVEFVEITDDNRQRIRKFIKSQS